MKSTTIKLVTLFAIAVSAIIVVANHDVTVRNNNEVKESYFSTHPLNEDSTVIIVDFNIEPIKDSFLTVIQK